MLSYSFINIDVVSHGFGTQRVALNVANGFVVDDYLKRNDVLKMRKMMADYQLPDSSVVIAGMGPILWYNNGNYYSEPEALKKFGTSEAAHIREGKEKYIVYNLSKEHVDRLMKEKYKIFYLQSMKSYIEKIMGNNFDSKCFKPIDIVVP
jgi:hypothetical protein